MSGKSETAILESFRQLAADLRPGEAPRWLLDRGRAMQFYLRARQAQPQQCLVSLYSAYVALEGAQGAAAAARRDLGDAGVRFLPALERCRQEGDADTGGGGVSLSPEELERLLSGVRRRILER